MIDGVLGSAHTLRTLSNALDYSREFRLYLIVCSTPAIADAVVEHIRARRGPVDLIPFGFTGEVRDLRARQQLVDDVARVLLRGPARAGVRVVDISRARVHETPDWTAVFLQLNLGRGDLQGSHAGPLFLVIPPWMEVLAQSAAPDVVSVQTGISFRFELDGPVAAPPKPRDRASDPPVGDPRALRREVLALLASAPQDRGGAASLRVATEALERAAEWHHALPGDRDGVRALADAHWWNAELALARGDLAAALDFGQTSMRQLRSLAKEGTGGGIWRDLAMRGAALARLLARNHRLDLAVDVADEAWRAAQRGGDDAARWEVGLAAMALDAQSGDIVRARRLRGELEHLAAAQGPRGVERLDAASAAFDGRRTLPDPITLSLPPTDASPPPPGAPYDPRWYTPRDALEGEARARLERLGEPVVLVGERGSGRTWLVMHLLSRLPPGSRALHVDLSAVSQGERTELERAFLAAVPEARGDGFRDPIDVAIEHGLRAIPERLYLHITVPEGFSRWEGWYDVELRLRLLNDLCDREPWDRLRLLLEYPPEMLSVTYGSSNSAFRLAVIHVGGLDEPEVAALAQRYRVSLSASEVRRLRERTGGNPSAVAGVLQAIRLGGGSLEEALGEPTPRSGEARG